MHYYKTTTDPNSIELKGISNQNSQNNNQNQQQNVVYASYPIQGNNNQYPSFGYNQSNNVQSPQYIQPSPYLVQGNQYNNQNNYPIPSLELVYNQPIYKPAYNDYYHKTIESDMIHRSKAVGIVAEGYTEFDDYFEKHIEKFFTPELHEITIYYGPGYIVGLQVIYRDSWGKYDKETYKGELHMPQNINKANCSVGKLTLEYDDYIKEIYVDGTEYITYLKIVSFKGKQLEVGKSFNLLENQVQDMTRVIGFGGSYGMCLAGIYFYYI